MNRDEAHAALLALAGGVRERDVDAAVARLLERVVESDTPELRGALLEAGAKALLLATRREGRTAA